VGRRTSSYEPRKISKCYEEPKTSCLEDFHSVFLQENLNPCFVNADFWLGFLDWLRKKINKESKLTQHSKLKRFVGHRVLTNLWIFLNVAKNQKLLLKEVCTLWTRFGFEKLSMKQENVREFVSLVQKAFTRSLFQSKNSRSFC